MRKIKQAAIGIACSALIMANSMQAMACTAVYVGKDVSADGTTMIARSEDIGGGYTKRFIVHEAKTHKKGEKFKDTYGFEMDLPEKTYRYTAVEDTPEQGEGDRPYGEAGFNEHGLAVTATVSAYYNEEAKAADPLEEKGLYELSIAEVVLSQCKTAKEGVELLASIVDKQGAGEGNIILLADQKEAWYMEILSGHQYAAIKMPTDKVAVVPNFFMLGKLDINDKDVITSENLVNLPKEHGFLVEEDGMINVEQTYGEPHAEHSTYRAWGGQTYLNPNLKVTPDDKTFQLFFDPADKVKIQDVIGVLSYRYEGTKYDTEKEENKNINQIGNERQAECHILQIRHDYPKALAGIEWLAMGNAEHSVFLPYYGSLITDTADAHKIKDITYNADSAYWSFRSIAALCDVDRRQYGDGVQKYWRAYQDKIINAQKKVDKEMLSLYKKDEKAAGRKATALGKAVTNEAIGRANRIYSELMQYFAADRGSRQKEPFATALMKNIVTNYSFKMADADSKDLLNAVQVTEDKISLKVKGDRTAAIKVTLPLELKKISKLTKNSKATDALITYKTNNEKVVSVSNSGKITAKKTGKATITITVKLGCGIMKNFKTAVTVK